MFAFFASKSGRAGLALPLSWLAQAATAIVVGIIVVITLILYGITTFWTPLCWIVGSFMFIRWCRKVHRAYWEGRS
jgi:hypothetical protein